MDLLTTDLKTLKESLVAIDDSIEANESRSRELRVLVSEYNKSLEQLRKDKKTLNERQITYKKYVKAKSIIDNGTSRGYSLFDTLKYGYNKSKVDTIDGVKVLYIYVPDEIIIYDIVDGKFKVSMMINNMDLLASLTYIDMPTAIQQIMYLHDGRTREEIDLTEPAVEVSYHRYK